MIQGGYPPGASGPKIFLATTPLPVASYAGGGDMAKLTAGLKDIYLDPEVEQELQDRLSRIEGHVRGVKRMLAEHASCEDLLLQLSAVRAALNQATARLLENHLDTCVAEGVRTGKGEKALRELKGALTQVIKNL